MIYIPEKYRKKDIIPIHKDLEALKGELEDRQARITLAKYLRSNLDVASELLLGIKLEPFQYLTIKALFQRTFGLNVWGRSVSKSFTARIFAILYLLFVPGSKVILTGPTFRTAKIMFNEITKLVRSPDAKLLHDVFDLKNKKERNEMHTWTIPIGNDISELIAIPLSGEKIRGLRANILIIDEFLLMPRDLVKRVLIPFILSPQDLKERQKIIAQEDILIKAGRMRQNERTKFETTAKLIGLSSASYQFEFLYEIYQEWVNEIYKDEKPEDVKAKYFVSRMSYQAAPPHMLEHDIIEDQKRDQGAPWFQREYEAIFLDDSDSYFSAKVMHKCTFPLGENPTLSLFGDPQSEYIISIDPSYSDAENADHFAMSVIKVTKEMAVYVHGYGEAAAKLNGYARYLRYLINAYNVKAIFIDNGGADAFINGCNESEYFRDKKLEIVDFVSHKTGMDYVEELKKAKQQMCSTLNKEKIFVIKRLFTSLTIREMNEYMQKSFSHRKMCFGSKINGNDDAIQKYTTGDRVSSHFNLIHFLDNDKGAKRERLIDLIDRQDMMLDLTIKECSLVEVSQTPAGNQTFDLPSKFKRDDSINRVRKDNYTSLMLGCWGARVYNEIMNTEEESKIKTFKPFILNS